MSTEQSATEPEQLKSLEQFLFEAPLYTHYLLPDDLKIANCLYTPGKINRALVGQKTSKQARVDGYCPGCHKSTTFTVAPVILTMGDVDPSIQIKTRTSYDYISIKCGRNDTHNIRYWFLLSKMKITKIGNYPVDVPELRRYA